MGLRVPVARLDAALDLTAAMVVRPDLPAEELERLRRERLTARIRQHDQPQTIASEALRQALYGADHVYARPVIGDEASLRAVEVDDVRHFHDRFFRPDNATVIVVGALDAAEARRQVEHAFAAWAAAPVPERQAPEARQVRGRSVVLVDRPGAAQSVIRMGRIGPPRDTPEYHALEVMNTVLGGSFTSRLNQNLREDKGYTYGARSGFEYLTGPGPFTAAADVHTAVTGPSLTEFMRELAAIREPIPGPEAQLARNFLAMRYPAAFQSVGAIAARLAEVVRYGLPDDYFNRYTGHVLEVRDADVAGAARRWVVPEDLVIVVVGDRSVIEPQIRALDLGELRVLAPVDVLGPVPVVGPPAGATRAGAT